MTRRLSACDRAAGPVNQFERAGRAEKIGKLLRAADAFIRRVEPGATDERIATWLEAVTEEDRRRLCLLAGVKTGRASATTWEMLVAAVRERQAIGERFGDEP